MIHGRRNTSPGYRQELDTPTRSVIRMQVSGTVTESGASTSRKDLVKAVLYNGDDVGTTQFVVKVAAEHSTGDDLWATLPEGGTDLTWTDDGGHDVPVLWMECSGGGGSRRRFVMITDNSTFVTGKLAAWKYKAIEVTDYWTPTGVPQVIPGAVEIDVLNMNEGNNPASGIGPMMTCPPVSADDFANGIKCQPLQVGSVWELIVQETCATTGSGTGTGTGSGPGPDGPLYFVDAPNFKGECPDGG